MQTGARRKEILLILLARIAMFALCLSAGIASAERVHKYTIAIDARLATLNVRACFSGAPPSSLSAESLDAILALSDVRVEGSRKPLEPNGSISLKSVPVNGCITYQVDVSRPIRQHDRSGDKIHRIGRDVVTSVGLWLWRPEQLADDEDIEVAFVLPEGIGVSVPWTPVITVGDAPAYRIGHGPFDWPASVAFGHFREREIRVGGARLRLAVLDGTHRGCR